ncbi:MAG: polysaccharide biosynthesis tyrosine autokinase [Bacteroidales bacterium]
MSPSNHSRVTEPLDLKKYLLRIFPNWYWFVVSLIVCLLIAWLVNRYTQPVYTASTTLMIKQTTPTAAGIENILDDMSGTRRRRQDDLYSDIEYLKSFQLVNKTLKNIENFDVSYFAIGNIKDFNIYTASPFELVKDSLLSLPPGCVINISILGEQRFLAEIKDHAIRETGKFGEPLCAKDICFTLRWREPARATEYLDNPNNIRKFYFYRSDLYDLTNQYQSLLSVRLLDERARTVQLSISGKNVQQAVDFLNVLTSTYVAAEKENKNLVAENTMTFIDLQLRSLSDSLRKDQALLMQFRLESGMFQMDNQGKELYEKILKLQDEKAVQLVKKYYLDYLDTWLNELEQRPDAVLPILNEMGSEGLTVQIQKYNDLLLERTKVNLSSQGQSPNVVELTAQINETRRIVREALQNEIRWLKVMLAEIDQRMDELDQDLRKIPSQEQVILGVQRKYDLTNNLYNFFLQKKAEMGISKASTVSNTEIFESADPRKAAMILPRTSSNFLRAAILGILLPLAVFVIIELLNNRVTTRTDVESLSKLPIAGVISHNRRRTDIPVHEHPRSVLAESFRSLRTNLQYIMHEPGCQSILISSTIPGEGKTFTSVNLAAVLALAGKKTLLISLDLRKPKIHGFFNIRNTTGISTYLIGKSKFEEGIFSTFIPNLSIATAGPVPPNPAELLEGPALASFFAAAREQFDFLVIDTPPVSVVSDSLHVSKFAQVCLFVIRQNYSRKNVLPLINELHEQGKMKNVCLVINDLKQATSYGLDYGYGYEYGYGYGKGYYEDENGTSTGLWAWLKKRVGR